MKILITPREVADIAFASLPQTDTDYITESVIISAQQKFIRPVLNGLYSGLENGCYPDLLEKHIKPALAHYVKLLVTPLLSAQVGSLGITQPKSSIFMAADDAAINALLKRTRSDALARMRVAVDYIETNQSEFPEYTPSDNVLNRVSISSQIVL